MLNLSNILDEQVRFKKKNDYFKTQMHHKARTIIFYGGQGIEKVHHDFFKLERKKRFFEQDIRKCRKIYIKMFITQASKKVVSRKNVKVIVTMKSVNFLPIKKIRKRFRDQNLYFLVEKNDQFGLKWAITRFSVYEYLGVTLVSGVIR